MPARGSGSQQRRAANREQRRKARSTARTTDYNAAQEARKADERERRGRLSVVWLDEPRPLTAHSAIKVVGVSSDAAQHVLDEWMPVGQKVAA
jgi:hypothetical protein